MLIVLKNLIKICPKVKIKNQSNEILFKFEIKSGDSNIPLSHITKALN